MAALMEVGGRKQKTCGINSKGLFQAISPQECPCMWHISNPVLMAVRQIIIAVRHKLKRTWTN